MEPNDLGRQQFYEYQTSGKYKLEEYGKSTVVDNYFFVLREGKHKYDLLVSEYRQMYHNGEWWGWYSLWLDWEGDRWMLPSLCRWYEGTLPTWLTNEGELNESKIMEDEDL